MGKALARKQLKKVTAINEVSPDILPRALKATKTNENRLFPIKYKLEAGMRNMAIKKPTIKEKDIQRTILDYLLLKRIFHWRNNTGAFASEYKGKKSFIRFGALGSPDIFILIQGIIYACEVKNEKGKQSDGQKAFQQGFEKAGGVYFIARTLEDVIKKLST